QNEGARVNGRQGSTDVSVPNLFRWSDSFTLRGGLEYRFLEAQNLAARLGYVFDSTTANKQYPTAFGTPPAPTHVLTAGAGYDGGPWEVNLAYAYRFGSTTVTAADLEGADECRFCGAAGEYAIALNGF